MGANIRGIKKNTHIYNIGKKPTSKQERIAIVNEERMNVNSILVDRVGGGVEWWWW